MACGKLLYNTAQPGALWRSQKWDGAGREAQQGGDIGILTADSHCCMAETNNTVKQLSSQLKIKIFKIIFLFSKCL